MKPKMKKSELNTPADIWNAVIHTICDFDFPSENKLLNDAFLVFQYHAELESGGHEALLNWWSEYIQEVGMATYVNQLSDIFEKIGAQDYSAILQQYGEEMWKAFVALENGEIDEEPYYEVIEKADQAYYKLENKLELVLESYFMKIHTEIIEVVE
ncbi:DMP19 family protein [Ferdinandcohnia sp. Marseille-Q9671]